MIASVVTVPIKEGGWEELRRLYQENVVSLVGGESGIVAVYLLEDPDNPENGMSIGIYESEEKVRASSEPDGAFAEAISQMAHLFGGQPNRALYQVTAHS